MKKGGDDGGRQRGGREGGSGELEDNGGIMGKGGR